MSITATEILFVPGIRAKPPAEQQEYQLRRCLHAALQRMGGEAAAQLAERLDIVGWSYHFYGVHADISADLSGIEAVIAGGGDPQRDRRAARSLHNRLTAAMYAIGDRFPVLSSLFATRRMETRMAEINKYFRDQQGEGVYVRRMLKERLRQAWEGGRRVVLIGHSFGSVIAYDTLWELTHDVARGERNGEVELFMTMGSPLTMNYIRRRIKGAGQAGTLRYPRNIRRWLNLAAVGEVTALDRRMADCFGGMLELGLVDEIRDNLDVLNRFRDPGGLNVHKCYGYLGSDTVARELLDFVAAAPATSQPG